MGTERSASIQVLVIMLCALRIGSGFKRNCGKFEIFALRSSMDNERTNRASRNDPLCPISREKANLSEENCMSWYFRFSADCTNCEGRPEPVTSFLKCARKAASLMPWSVGVTKGELVTSLTATR